MSGEQKRSVQPAGKELLKDLRDASEAYVLMSVCTKAPYVVCDKETFDDEVFLFFSGEEAKEEAKRLVGEKIPVGVARIEQKQMLLFYTSLYTMGVNALHIIRDGQEYEVQLENFVKRSEPEKQPDGKVWVENPSLHLTSLYYMQELRRQPGRENDPELREMQEEIAANFGKGRYIAAVQKEGNGVPLVKLKNGDQYQPIFTDILEFQRFNRENSMRPVVVEAKNLPKLLPPQVKGILLNPTGVNMPLMLRRNVETRKAPEKENGEQ